MKSIEEYRSSYQEGLVRFIGDTLRTQYEEVKHAAKSNNLEDVIRGLRTRFLLHTIVVDLYEKEYPFIAEKIYQEIPELKDLAKQTESLNNQLLEQLQDGITIIGANKIYKEGNELSLVMDNGDLYKIKPENTVTFPPFFEEKRDTQLNSSQEDAPIFDLGIENAIDTLTKELNGLLHQKHDGDLGIFHEMAKTKIDISHEDAYHNLANLIIQHAQLKDIVGYDRAKQLCEERFAALEEDADEEAIAYNKTFLENFSAEYHKRVQFLALILRFISHIPERDEYIWFLRDQIEPYILYACRDAASGEEQKNHKLITISRNSTSLEPKDHFLYVVLNDIFYRAANQANGSYEKFMNYIRQELAELDKSDTRVQQINKEVLKHCSGHNLLQDGTSAVSIDTGFQGTFNMYLEALLMNESEKQGSTHRMTHYLTGIWPWLSNILKGQYETTYFPAILTIEFFDGLHEVAKFDYIDDEGNARFKPASAQHQMPAFLDLIIIHDLGILAGTKKIVIDL